VLLVSIYLIFHLENYDYFNGCNLPQETATLYNVKNSSYCDNSLEIATLYFVVH